MFNRFASALAIPTRQIVSLTTNWTTVSIRNSRWRWVIIAVVVLAAIAAAIIGSVGPSSNVTLTNLNNVTELRDQFNRDAGKVRVLLLLSPT